jgi:hypothetical protein
VAGDDAVRPARKVDAARGDEELAPEPESVGYAVAVLMHPCNLALQCQTEVREKGRYFRDFCISTVPSQRSNL